MAKSKAQWFRVRIDAEGKVLECTPVDEVGTDGGGVFYVQALSETLAGKRAYNSYYRLRQRAHRAKLRAEGKCDCGRPVEDQRFVCCQHCRERSRLYDERAKARRRGDVVQPLSRAASRDERRADDLNQTRLEWLLEAKRAYDRSLKSETFFFSDWLRQQIALAGGKKVA